MLHDEACGRLSTIGLLKCLLCGACGSETPAASGLVLSNEDWVFGLWVLGFGPGFWILGSWFWLQVLWVVGSLGSGLSGPSGFGFLGFDLGMGFLGSLGLGLSG